MSADPAHVLVNDETVKLLLQDVLQPHEEEGEAAGDVIGHYHLKERLGEGGFGVVWLARQVAPVDREVALKLLKPGMDSREVLARFQQERQVLATMEHPCIAAMLDAGMTSEGRPFFVMELVRGLPLTRHAWEKKMTLRARLELFIDLCRGVQHAHQKGVIHRDLKPSNILVVEVDGGAVPKIIDFGIAKALMAKKLTSLTLLTRAGTALGTPLYMAPEQVSGQDLADTRSDVYALGALLYELLTGSPPFPVETLTAKGEDEMRRIIREVTPMRPSRRLAKPKLPSDLDWITLRALEKDPRRRYASAADLAADVERFLTDEPVLAHPPEWRYLAGLWIKRHRAAFAAILISVAALISGTALALWQADEAQKERNTARKHEAQALTQTALAVAAEKHAQKEKQRAEQTASFLSQLLEHAAEEVAGGRNPEALAGALRRSDEMLRKITQDAAMQADLLKRISRLYVGIGDWRNAIAALRERSAVEAKLRGADSEKASSAMLDYLKLEADHGTRGAVPDQLAGLQSRIEKAGGKGGKLWFDVLREKVRVWIKLDDRHQALKAGGDLMAAVAEWKVRGQMRLDARITHATALEFAGRYDEALALLEVCRITGIEEKADEKNARAIESRQLLILETRGDHQGGAAVLLRRLEAMRAAKPPEKARSFIATLLQLAGFESAAGQHQEAMKHASEALDLARKPDSAEPGAAGAEGDCLVSLAECETAAGQHEAAVLHAREARLCALENGKKRNLIGALEQLAWSLLAAGRQEEAFAVWQEACEAHADDPNFKSVFYPLAEMAAIRHGQKRHAEAVEIIRDIWRRCITHPLGATDIGELGYTARLGLKYWAAQVNAAPGTQPPAELAAWQKAEETYRTQYTARGRAPADKGRAKPERVRKSDG